jgi:hypothetical protein
VSHLVANVTWTDLVSLTFVLQAFSQDWISKRVAWSFWEAVAGSWSVAMTEVSPKNVAVMESSAFLRWIPLHGYANYCIEI